MSDQASDADEAWHLLHRGWSACVGLPGYDKRRWVALEGELLKHLRAHSSALRSFAGQVLALAQAQGASVTAESLGLAGSLPAVEPPSPGPDPATAAERAARTMTSLYETLAGRFQGYMLARVARCWVLADREEQLARRRTVIALVLELERIKAADIFATRLGEAVIDHVIEGDWSRVREAASDFRFEDQGDDVRARYAPLWAAFVETAETEAVLAEGRAGRDVDARPS